MDIQQVYKEANKEKNSVIFVCKYCGDLFWSYDERNKHRENCEYKKVIPFKN